MSSHVETRFSTRHLHCPHKGLFILMSEVRHRWRKPIAQRFNPPSYGAVPPIAERERERGRHPLCCHTTVRSDMPEKTTWGSASRRKPSSGVKDATAAKREYENRFVLFVDVIVMCKLRVGAEFPGHISIDLCFQPSVWLLQSYKTYMTKRKTEESNWEAMYTGAKKCLGWRASRVDAE